MLECRAEEFSLTKRRHTGNNNDQRLPDGRLSAIDERLLLRGASPGSSAGSVNARPRPREAPVMSHTFDTKPLSAVHRKLAADETVNQAILFGCIAAHGVCNVILLQVRCGFFDQSCNLLESGRSRVCSRSYLLSRGSTGISTEATGNDHGLTART
jgi:hypothetical protein